jgi:hypothetical protein
MPKILTAAMRAHLDAETTRLVAIWRITRKDGAQFFFTDHDRDIDFGGDSYRADAGFERTAIRSDAGFAVDNLDLVGVFAEGGIVEDEVRAGLFDGAEIAISFVNWQDPDGHGEIRLRCGTLGETRLTPQGYFTAELRGLSQPLAQSTLEVFSPNCRADLGDQRCRFPIEPPELGRDQAVSEGAFYSVPTTAGTGSARYEDRIYEVIEAGTTAASQPAYDITIGATTVDGTADLKAYDSFTRVASVESVTDHRVFILSEDLAGFADGWFDEGAVTFETGANAGRTIEVKSWTQAIRRLELWSPTGLPVAVDIAHSLGVYALSTLLRGRRGTEVFTGSHAVGDLFVLLGGDGVTRRPLGLDRLGDTLHYRAVGRGGELRNARTAQLTLAGNDLKPYAPAQLAATGSWGSNITLSWQRRTRVGGELIDGSGEVPLAEDSEEYELEILHGPGGAVLRTETGITTTSFTYTAGMQSADFGSAQTELSFVVYQISAQVGRGFPGEGTVDL